MMFLVHQVRIFGWLAVFLLVAADGFGQQPSNRYIELQQRAARYYAEHSYALAHQAWSEAAKLDVPEGDRRMLDFYLADSLWRSRPDAEQVAQAREQLEKLVGKEVDPLGAEALESLGDSWLAIGSDWPRAWSYYKRALDYWAASTDRSVARPRYLGIVWKATGPPEMARHDVRVPLDVLVKALSIAETSEDRARAHYFLAMYYSRQGDVFSQHRAGAELRAAVEAGSGTAVYEQALFSLAEWNLRAGRSEWLPDGGLRIEPNYDEALVLFRRFVREFPEGSSALTPDAKSQVAQLTEPNLNVAIGQQFHPGSKVEIRANWRNIPEITFSIHRVDLAAHFKPTDRTTPDNWLDAVEIPKDPPVREWKEASPEGQTHAPRSRTIELEPFAEPGAFLVVAKGNGRSARELLLVTDGVAMLKAGAPRTAGFFCHAITGAAMEGSATVWSATHDGKNSWNWQRLEPGEAERGVQWYSSEGGGYLLLLGAAEGNPVVVRQGGFGRRDRETEWRVQVFTDRAAYRPGETVRWKLIARELVEGAYRTPAGEILKFAIHGPNGEKVGEGEVKLTAFGGAWGELEVTPEMMLGEYTIAVVLPDKDGDSGWALGMDRLFRLEEYRLPEFKVAVTTDNGPDGVRLGEAFTANVSAEYYFGGPVADAEVEIVVNSGPFVRPLPFGDDARLREGFGDEPTTTVLKKTLRTGPDGTASVQVQTPLDASYDLLYTIQARVVDSSGREVIANARNVVGRQSYFAELKASRRVAQPEDLVEVSIETADGNEKPVSTRGVVTVFREKWTEVWRAPDGREVSGDELAALKKGIFPPEGQYGWLRVKAEYVSEEISRTELGTDAGGKGSFEFRPAQEGFYRIAWSSPDADGPPVQGSANVWVSSTSSEALGYRSGGVEILVDPEAAKGEGPVPVLVTTSTSGRDVFFTISADSDLFHAEVLHLDGDARLVQLERRPEYVPNVYLEAGSVHGREFFAAFEELRLPPTEHTLQLTLRSGAETYAPGAEGTVELEVKDPAGNPVQGEFAVAVTDEAISYIQKDYAGDPVEFFFGRNRHVSSSITSSISTSPFYVKREGILDLLTKEKESESAIAGGSLMREMAMSDMSAFGSPAVEEAGLPAEEPVSAQPAVEVRTNFSSTAFWNPGVVTDEKGRASLKFRYPDSLTTWRILARGATKGAEFGEALASTRTTKPLIARLQTPRFLVSGDRVDVTGVINNRTDKLLDARVELFAEGLEGTPKAQRLRVEAGRDAKAMWPLSATTTGEAKLALTAVSGDLSDGLSVTLPVLPNGIEKSVSVSGKAVARETKWTLEIPEQRRENSESLVITATPSLAATALDALPYLIRYPYGCVEQTMSRFLPAAVTARTLQSLGLDRKDVANRIFGGIEREYLAKTHPAMEGDAGLEELDAVIAKGLGRLYDFQHADGAWGWWKEDGSDPFMTAYVVWGLRLAQQSGVSVRSDVLNRAAEWLRKHLVEAEDRPDLQAWLLHAVCSLHTRNADVAPEVTAAVENLWAKRDSLSSYGRALFALSVQWLGDGEKAQVLARNLHDSAARDDQPGVSQATGVGQPDENAVPTVHWGNESTFLRWQDSGVEATAFALQALLAIDPKSELIEPAMNWLVKNRRGAQWSNTRDTAISVLAMNRYLVATGQLGEKVSFSVEVNGEPVGEVKDAGVLDGQTQFAVDRKLLRSGANEIALKRTAGDGPVYFSARAEFFTLEEPIPPAGNEIFAKREYFRYDPKLTLLDGYRFDRIVWGDGEEAASNQRVQVVLTIEAKNDLEYLVFEDLKPAGLEAVDVRSGEFLTAEGPDGKRLPVYCELRDRKIALFLRNLPQGVWTIRYDLRTEMAGDFSALPVVGHAMYVPEIRCNSTSRRVKIGAAR